MLQKSTKILSAKAAHNMLVKLPRKEGERFHFITRIHLPLIQRHMTKYTTA